MGRRKNQNRRKKKAWKNKIPYTSFPKETHMDDDIPDSDEEGAICKGTTTTGKAYTYVPCHPVRAKIWSGEGITIWAGGSLDGARPHIGDILIDVGAGYLPLGQAEGFPKAGKYLRLKAHIKIPWTDGSVPNLPRRFWTSLIEDIRAMRTPANVFVSCQGGHGRTGTTLAILGYLMGWIPEGEDPVGYIRDNYCEDAIETDEQLDYIEKITGAVVLEEARPPVYSGTTAGYTSGGYQPGLAKFPDYMPDEKAWWEREGK